MAGEYTPAPGSAVHLGLGGEYTPAAGGAVPLRLGGGPERTQGSLVTGWQLRAGGSVETAWALLAGGALATGWATTSWPPIEPGLYHLTSPRYGTAPRRETALGCPFAAPAPRRRQPAAPWGTAERLCAVAGEGWEQLPARHREHAAAWDEPAQQLRRATCERWRQATPRGRERALAWDALDQRRGERAVGWRYPPERRAALAAGWQAAERLARPAVLPFAYPSRLRPSWEMPWGQATLIRWQERWGKELRQPFYWQRQGPDGTEYYHPDGGDRVRLALACPLLDWPGYAVWLFLRTRPCPPTARTRRAWFVMNSLHVVRLPDRAPVPCLGASLTTDFDSWAWGLSLTLPDREALALVSPVGGAPVAVEVTINGHVWTALVEGYEERRQFGQTGWTAAGRSLSACLAAPYAAARSFAAPEARTAHQLAAAEVADAGWELAWNVPDWLVPAGAYAYAQKTPLEALASIAEAVGARVQSDPKDERLRVLSRYPLAPWEWAAAEPSAVLTESLVTSLGLRWEERPGWNGVYVGGQNQGVLVSIKRAGSDGALQAPMILDPLITEVAAGRERGVTILSAGGKQARVTIELPLLPYPQEPGLLLPGQLVEVQDGVETWKGLVTGATVTAGRPTVRQRLELERHY